MQDMSDKEFDELFKKAAEDYDIPYNPKAWDRMRAKLDKAGGIGGGNMRKIVTGLVLFILLGTGTLLYFGSSQAISPKQVTKSQNNNTSAETAEQEGKYARQSPDKVVGSLETTGPDVSEKEVEQGQVPSRNSGQSSRKITPSSSGEEKLITQIALQPSVSSKRSRKVAAGEAHGAYQHLSYLPPQLWTPLPAIRTPPGFHPKEITVPKKVLALLAGRERNRKESRIHPGQHPFYRAGLSFTVSPDFSAIGLTHISQVGSKSGIGLEFFIFRNLSLNTGAILSHKVYAATGGYEPSPGFWNYYPKPSSIDAECKVLDIPLNLRYYAFNWNKNRIYLSGGLSSYLMLQEDYEYNYDVYDPYQYRFHSARNKNHHYFKVSSFSVGYERALGKQWALQAEPFVKIPLAGVGEGKVKLFTAGIFMTLNYRFGLSGSNKK